MEPAATVWPCVILGAWERGGVAHPGYGCDREASSSPCDRRHPLRRGAAGVPGDCSHGASTLLPLEWGSGFGLQPPEGIMLWTIFVILLVLWLLGMVSSYTMGGFIHILLVIAVVILIINLIGGRRTL